MVRRANSRMLSVTRLHKQKPWLRQGSIANLGETLAMANINGITEPQMVLVRSKRDYIEQIVRRWPEVGSATHAESRSTHAHLVAVDQNINGWRPE